MIVNLCLGLLQISRLQSERGRWLQSEKKYLMGLRELDTQLSSLEQDLKRDQEHFMERIRVLETEGRSKENPELDRALRVIDYLEAQIHELQIHMNKVILGLSLQKKKKSP